MSRYPRRRLLGALVTLLLLAAPVPAVARTAAASVPVTVPALTNWTSEQGSYKFDAAARLVADSAPERRVADTLADDLRDAGHGLVPVVSGGARAGDIVIDVVPGRVALGAEGYELRAGARLSVTGATETGAFYGTRTVLQLLAQGDRVPAGRTVDVPRYAERGVGVCACYVHISTPWLENLVRDMAYHKLNQLLLELKVKSDAHPEADTWGYYTKDEIRRLVALGDKYHVEIVPEIDSPGHMDPWIDNRPDLQLTDSDGNKQPSRLDITQPAAFDHYTSLIDEYAQVFTGGSWHMGADEYMLGSDFAKYPQMLRYAREKYGANATPQDTFIDFVNRTQTYLVAKGKKLRIWNDGLTGANTVPVTAGPSAQDGRPVDRDLLRLGRPQRRAPPQRPAGHGRPARRLRRHQAARVPGARRPGTAGRPDDDRGHGHPDSGSRHRRSRQGARGGPGPARGGHPARTAGRGLRRRGVHRGPLDPGGGVRHGRREPDSAADVSCPGPAVAGSGDPGPRRGADRGVRAVPVGCGLTGPRGRPVRAWTDGCGIAP
nr:beta-N-acetylhexosaminidase [Streptomyces sp. SID12501]